MFLEKVYADGGDWFTPPVTKAGRTFLEFLLEYKAAHRYDIDSNIREQLRMRARVATVIAIEQFIGGPN